MKEFDIQKAEESIAAIQAQIDALDAGGAPPEGLTSEAARMNFLSHINMLRRMISEAGGS